MTDNRRKTPSHLLCAGLLLIVIGGGCATPQGETVQDKRAFVREMRDSTLAELYAAKPEAKASLNSAAGYAVFSNVAMKFFALGSGNGYGIAVDNASGKEGFMRMAELGVGVGLGAKNVRTVFIFKDKERFRTFLTEGWTVGAEAAATAKTEEEGGSTQGEMALEEGIEVYQFTDKGLMADAMISGTKYWKDEKMCE